MGFRPDVKRLPLFGLGCVAGAAGIARGAEMAAAHPRGVVLLLSVEICSMTYQRGDHSTANVIATGLFGDGAAAVVLAGREREIRGAIVRAPVIEASRSVLYPGTERVMGWEISEEGFRLILSPEIPFLIQRRLKDDLDAFLADQGARREEVGAWIVHTGGPKIFSAIEETLALGPAALATTRASLRESGNLSSASVLFVLRKILDAPPPPPGTRGVMLAVGPGFCLEMVLLRW
jgi:alkylresorcinol/alkylpyrone synthase